MGAFLDHVSNVVNVFNQPVAYTPPDMDRGVNSECPRDNYYQDSLVSYSIGEKFGLKKLPHQLLAWISCSDGETVAKTAPAVKPSRKEVL